jgi:hypothetical protein
MYVVMAGSGTAGGASTGLIGDGHAQVMVAPPAGLGVERGERCGNRLTERQKGEKMGTAEV